MILILYYYYYSYDRPDVVNDTQLFGWRRNDVTHESKHRFDTPSRLTTGFPCNFGQDSHTHNLWSHAYGINNALQTK